jgi:tRNA(fMet)-specific endonuclease VapC
MPLPAGYLLDTNILVHLLRNNALGQFLDATYRLLALPQEQALCIVTVGELYALALKFGWGAGKRAAMNALLGTIPRVDVNDPQVLEEYGNIDAWSHGQGRKMGKNDLWIAATALVTNRTVLTTDTDFDHLHPPDTTRAWRVDREWVVPNSKLAP